jgi:hypothetical protein
MTQTNPSLTEQDRLARLSSAAKHVAEFAASATNRSFVALLEAKTEVVKDQLATAELSAVPGLQSQIQLMRSLITVANGRPEGI